MTDDERKALRALLGKLIWVARQTMPQIAYDVSDLQQRVTAARVTDLVQANSVVRQMHKDTQSGYRLKFLPIQDLHPVDGRRRAGRQLRPTTGGR